MEVDTTVGGVANQLSYLKLPGANLFGVCDFNKFTLFNNDTVR